MTSSYAVKGVALIGGAGKIRSICVLTAAYFGVLKKSKSFASGDYIVNLGDYFDPVIVVHYDEYGYPFATNKTYSLDDVIHPSTPNGYRYICTTTAADGTWSLTTDYTGPLLAVAWSQTDNSLQPVVLGPIMG